MIKDEAFILKENIQNFLKSANIIYNSGDFTSATILYFKCLFAVLDLIILKNQGKVPKDHSERFKILEKNYPSFYELLDKLYSLYRDTYSLKINKENCLRVRLNVERIIKEQKIFEDY